MDGDVDGEILNVGTSDGLSLGTMDGISDGAVDSNLDGLTLGTLDGISEGAADGAHVGFPVVGIPVVGIVLGCRRGQMQGVVSFIQGLQYFAHASAETKGCLRL